MALSESPIISTSPEMAVLGAGASPAVAVATCTVMALGYVLVLYVPTFVLRLPPPKSPESFLIRRFICALIFSAISAFASAAVLGIEKFADLSGLLSLYGIREDHMWQAVFFPLFLTCLLYTGSLVSKVVFILDGWRKRRDDSCCELDLCKFFAVVIRSSLDNVVSCAHNVVAWRNYVVAPFSEELVFRACMIPLFLCSGFRIQTIIFIGPVFFSLAHLNHFMELYYQQGYSFLKAFSIVGFQLGYTVVFGWYASFLFIRTGNLISAVIAHVFCNVMGLPVLLSPRTRGLVTIAFILGLVCFLLLLFPASDPILYNNSVESCSCWQGYCGWR